LTELFRSLEVSDLLLVLTDIIIVRSSFGQGILFFSVCFNLSTDLERLMLGWLDFYLTDLVQLVKLDDFLSEPVYCHSGVPQGSFLGTVFFIDDDSALGYADDLKLFMTINNADDGLKFQSDLNCLQQCATKSKTIFFIRSKQPITFSYRIGDHDLERVEEIKDFGNFCKIGNDVKFHILHFETV
jgi:hypothetical protein